MSLRISFVAALSVISVAACSPTFDWRVVRPDEASVEALFPCKPKSHARYVMLAGGQVHMYMYACEAAGHVYALTFAELGDPVRVTPALREMRTAASANINGVEASALALEVAGMTPNEAARRVDIKGKLPDGTAVRQQAGFFARGTYVYQASIVGPKPEDEASDNFFGGLKLL
jgi:hypothetical protein